MAITVGPNGVVIPTSVDNGWLATALHLVSTSVPELSTRAEALFESMHFGFYYRPAVNRIAFFYAPDTGESPCCYDTIVSESRIASYIGIATGEIPSKEYFGAWRTFPDTCDWSWQETKPVGFHRTYYGVNVFEGAYEYDGMRIVPGWGGSMFEALMPALFVPEDQWGEHSWAINHPLTVAAQIHHGLVDAGYGYWGFSPSNTPEGGYAAYGVDAIGMNPDGYPSNEDNTFVDHGFAGCPGRDPKPDPPPSAYTNGVVTPHASFLALRWAPTEVMANLARLEHDFAIYDKWDFHDSVNVDSGVVSPYYLALDQGIIMAAIGNALHHDMLRRAFTMQEFRSALKPVISIEVFNAGARAPALPVSGRCRDVSIHNVRGGPAAFATGVQIATGRTAVVYLLSGSWRRSEPALIGFRNGGSATILDERLERALTVTVGVPGTERIEVERALALGVGEDVVAGHVDDLGRGVDELADQPGAGDPVGLGVLAGDPLHVYSSQGWPFRDGRTGRAWRLPRWRRCGPSVNQRPSSNPPRRELCTCGIDPSRG